LVISSESTEARWTVVVVDDDPTFAELIRMALCLTTKWRVIVVPSVREARTLLSSLHADVLLVDERMPEESGSELVLSLFGTGALTRTTAILVTAQRDVAPCPGIAGVIPKPFNALGLATQISGLVRRRSSDRVGS
jgi:two-component system phosphate regulon response regulator OmpR